MRCEKKTQIVVSANSAGLIPNQFKDSPEFEADLINYIFDSKMPYTANGNSPASKAYNNIITILGKELYDNRTKVIVGKYTRPSTTHIILRKSGLDNQLLKPIITPQKMNENKLQQAVDEYNKNYNASIDQPTVGNGGGG